MWTVTSNANYDHLPIPQLKYGYAMDAYIIDTSGT